MIINWYKDTVDALTARGFLFECTPEARQSQKARIKQTDRITDWRDILDLEWITFQERKARLPACHDPDSYVTFCGIDRYKAASRPRSNW